MRPLPWVVLAVALGGTAVLATPRSRDGDGDFLFEEDDWKQKEKPAVKTWIWDPENGLCSALQCRNSEMCLLEDSFTALCVSRSELKSGGDRIISRQLAEDEHLIKAEPWLNEDVDDDDDDDEDDDFLDNDEDDAEMDLDGDDADDDYDYDDDDDDDETGEDPDARKEAKKNKLCGQCPYTQPSVSEYICGTDNRTYSSRCRLQQHNCLHGATVTTHCKGFCPCKELGPHRHRKQQQRSQSPREEVSDTSGRLMKKTRLKSKYEKYHQDRKSFNDVKYYTKSSVKPATHHSKCSKTELAQMGSRLVDWFGIIKANNKAVIKANYHKHHGGRLPAGCTGSARWMYLHLDTDGSGQLTQTELSAVESDKYEPCLRPFIDRCDLDGDMLLTGREWCRCFEEEKQPCYKRLQAANTQPGSYVASCDSAGLYQPTQCDGRQCWCVDRQGRQLAGTRARRGHTRCGDSASDVSAFGEDDEDNEVVDGSGEGPSQLF